MKQYSEVIERRAGQAFGQYMNGSNDTRLNYEELKTMAFIYDKNSSDITDDFNKAFKVIQDTYYKGK